MDRAWNEDMEQSKKRKREWRSSSDPAAACGDNQNMHSQHNQQQQQQNLIPQHQRSHWIDLTTCQLPLPPGWEQCLDLQTGKMYFVNWATQSKTLEDPRKPQILNNNNYMNQNHTTGNNNNNYYSYNNTKDHHGESLYGMVMMQANVGHQHLHHDQQPPPPQPHNVGNGSMCQFQRSSMELAPNANMSTTICLHCYTFVMIPHSSPLCPNCKNACNIGLNSTPSLIK